MVFIEDQKDYSLSSFSRNKFFLLSPIVR